MARGEGGWINPGEHRSVTTEFRPGQPSWIKGKLHTEESKAMMRLAKLGRTLTEEQKRKISASCKGKIISPARRLKLSIAHRGLKKPWAAETGRKQALKQRGANHWNWKNGNSRAYKTGYYSIEYKNWRREVFVRDSYICKSCGSRNPLQAHHIKGFTEYPLLRFDANNGVTLCKDCHKLIHRKEMRKSLYQKE